MGIFAQIQSAVDSILPQLYEDEDLTTIVTWRKFSDSDFDEDAGVNVDTYTDFTNITAIKVEKEVSSRSLWQTGQTSGSWGIASGDVIFLFRDQHVPEGVSIRDLIVDNDTGYTYSVKKIFPVFNLIVKVEVSGYA
jgi:hypothetical protein